MTLEEKKKLGFGDIVTAYVNGGEIMKCLVLFHEPEREGVRLVSGDRIGGVRDYDMSISKGYSQILEHVGSIEVLFS